MTFPLKESLIHFEQLSQRQGRIYNDAADFGVKVDPRMREAASIELIKLMKFYGYKMTRWGEPGRSRSWGSRTTVFIPIEHDEGGYAGIVLDVSFNEDKPRKIQFLSINERREVLKPADAKAKYGCKVLEGA